MQARFTAPELAGSFSIRYDPSRGVFTKTSMIQDKVLSLKDLRERVCMAQGNTREIPDHVLRFIQESGTLKGETRVKVGATQTEVLK